MNKGRIHVRWFEAGAVLAVVAAFVVIGPLRDAFATVPGVMMLATLVLFSTPGVVIVRWFFREYFSGAALAPAAFVTSVGLFALLAVPMLILQVTLAAYLWACGITVAVCWLAAVVLTFRPERAAGGVELSDHGGMLWVPFGALVAALAYIARITAPSYYGDVWIYLSWVREYLDGDRLASVEPFFGGDVGLSRARINGWLLEQTAVARVSGVDPVDLAFSYLNPALVVVAFLGFYALARILFASEGAALLSGCLYSLFFLVHLSQSRIAWGGEFVQRLPEDKLVAKFLFLPLALACAFAFLEGGAKRYFVGFTFLCCAVMAVHPIGLAIIGISMAGFAVMHLAAGPRTRAAWARISAMGLAGVAIVAVPAVLVSVFTDEPLSNALADSDINSGDPDVLRNMIFVSPERNRIFEFADGSYMMHPSLLLDPMIATAFLIGLPFLLWRVQRSLAARLLFGVMYVTTVVVYVPPITTFLGDNVVLPGQIWRLAWPIQLAAVLTLGWLVWTAIGYVTSWLQGLGPARYLAGVLPALLVVVLTVAVVPQARRGMESIQAHREASRTSGFYPSDPIFPWFRDEMRSPVVVLAPDIQSARIPAYSSEANVVSRRGGLVLRVLPELEKRAPGRIEVPQGSLDVQEFFSGTTLQERVEILRRNNVDYVMVANDSQLTGVLARLSGFTPVGTPSERYALYAVDLQKLA
ncbi:MAG: Lead, cadmium, zinc and mercury transporting ATPase; Copper-translocating P-type ATPase [uncultured Rubrobacteraceae bacterium]|uniref:Lead, cadmium, zinc and mercury transporting ATPase Copper-translocating P-type ATPase n=1 Tax=uncultured Rubrobacteraceae bacterium TaxID=349277 RepID=A0A6J4RL76_9ACTN|nr:MAG: Lead, cadmium, zinc and mercury transporting ATPase; Copper-translocating P-type ATPase [uncultured Rubrobacteraceae bacterium]